MIDDLLATDESDDDDKDDSFIIGLWCLTPFLTIIHLFLMEFVLLDLKFYVYVL
jgi:hypothetical protein